LTDQNDLFEITLPLEQDQADFTVEVGGLIIESLSKTEIQGGDELLITVSGIEDNKELYSVSFITRSGDVVSAAISTIESGVVTVSVPHYDLMEIGPVTVRVEEQAEDDSDDAELIFIPEDIQFLPGSTSSEGELELAITQVQGLPDIYYTLNDSLAEQGYSAPITIPDLTTVSAWVVKVVDGTEYRSNINTYSHKMCSEGYIFVDGRCQESCTPVVCSTPVVADSISFPGYRDVFNITFNFDKTYKMCFDERVDSSSLNGHVTMLYFFETDGTSLYQAPSSYSLESGSASVDVSYSSFNMSLSPSADYNSDTVKYFDPETLFRFSMSQYDYLWVYLSVEGESVDDEDRRTIINPERVGANGCAL
jgi:hypothetical protein